LRVLLALLVIVNLGCKPHARAVAKAPDVPAPVIRVKVSHDELKPESYDSKSSVIVFAGLKIPVEVSQKNSGGQLKLSFLSYDQELSSEEYVYSKNEFGLATVDEEQFNPPIPLLRFPFTTGDTWKWKGTIKEGTANRPATAEIHPTMDRAVFDGQPQDAVKSAVILKIDGGTPRPSSRENDFWFVNGHGPVKRTIGQGSSRNPPVPDKGKA